MPGISRKKALIGANRWVSLTTGDGTILTRADGGGSTVYENAEESRNDGW